MLRYASTRRLWRSSFCSLKRFLFDVFGVAIEEGVVRAHVSAVPVEAGSGERPKADVAEPDVGLGIADEDFCGG